MSKSMLAAFATAALCTTNAGAHEGPGGDFGFGIGVGAPTGLTLELAASRRSSFELAVGFNFFGDSGGYAHLVYKRSLFALTRGPSVVVPLYLGLGAFLFDHDGLPNHNIDLGVRVPVGVNFDFQRSSVQLFIEAAFMALAAKFGDYHDNWITVGAYGGVRFWF